jgi:hypothetical protein
MNECFPHVLSLFGYSNFKGTTIGYGNLTPSTNLGKVGVSLYAILACNVLGGLLEPARSYFESFCQRKRIPQEASTAKKKHNK